MSSEWWNGNALSQNVHERINAVNYPGTRQLCDKCDMPTGRCAEDEIRDSNGNGPFCELCWVEHPECLAEPEGNAP